MGKVRNFFKELALLPVVNAALTIAGVLAGYLGSHYDKRISEAIYPFFVSRTSFDLAVTIFWVVLLIFGACLTGTAWAQKVSDEELNGEFKDSLRVLFTMPAKGFLQRYQKISLASTNFIWALPSTLPSAHLEQAIRMQLFSICNVVKEYDGASSAATYGCNVMIFVAGGSPNFATNQVALQQRLKCIEAGVAITNLAGVLDLQVALSISSVSSSAPDPNLSPLALPVPHLTTNAAGQTDYSQVVPGAPYAFASGRELVFSNQQQLIDEVATNRSFSTTVLQGLEDILGPQSAHVQSLICIPLFPSPQPGATSPPQPIGVLNIHKSDADALAAAKFQYLSPLLTPLVQNLGNLVEQVQ
ncbi:hypothetical protein [Janthinobacterium lividum]|uniref:hypothetical protein n=1 Tax=Janthinobacterium lividum TaxID=29581 RepID=UPI0015961D85|nr:hypothetical protein [Janthinobacterium lividum]QKY12151.1 hypothetical protein G8765_30245 [Janthinobacterium lividum]